MSEMIVLLAEEETEVKVESLIKQLVVEATIMAIDLDEEVASCSNVTLYK